MGNKSSRQKKHEIDHIVKDSLPPKSEVSLHKGAVLSIARLVRQFSKRENKTYNINLVAWAAMI